MNARLFLFSLLLTVSFGTLTAQNTFQPRIEDSSPRGFVYNTETTVDIKLHTYGGFAAIGLNFGTLRTYNKTRFWNIEVGELRHQKETKLNFEYPSGPNGRVSRPFRFGKQNSLYAVRVGLGHKRYLSEKAKDKGVAVGYSYTFGPVLGLLKPYQLELFITDPIGLESNPTSSVRYSEETADRFLALDQIYGASGFTRGLGGTQPRPGAFFRVAAHFDWGAFDEYVKAFEVGLMGDIFLLNTPLMVPAEGVENRPFYLNFFVAAQFGKRKL